MNARMTDETLNEIKLWRSSSEFHCPIRTPSDEYEPQWEYEDVKRIDWLIAEVDRVREAEKELMGEI